MCLNCKYSNYGKCKLCCKSACISKLHICNKICQECYGAGKVQYKSRCRECGVIFESRNKLFKHLEKTSHKKDPLRYTDKIYEKYLEWNIDHTYQYFPASSWIESYVILGFRA